MTKIYKNYKSTNIITLYLGDCQRLLKHIDDDSIDLIITSPPYCMGKAYENPHDDLKTFREQHQKIFDDIYRIVKPGGSICWQVGYHVSGSCVVPLDFIIYELFTELSKDKEYPLVLRNRIIWTFGHGLNSTKRFSGRHETILWFTKGKEEKFNLDAVRVPQKYPGKKSYSGPNKGKLSGNPLGKNPSDVWDIPNVNAHHVEKTIHPCQFPIAIPERLIKALTNEGDTVLDPFMGVGSTGVAAILNHRRFIGAEIQKDYYEIANNRVNDALKGKAKVRDDKPPAKPNKNAAVARLPEEFKQARTKVDNYYGNTEDEE
ncbi:DNA-methyltransferase [Anaerolactibacter massiliensis]|uniref:DNA-methyltransferase n=1 Tax=Anaerolactibacter massiliensis TaxID=2044573 RepID=UPI000CF88DDC|nr:site-specific DNA-methyltransferase [Anaerolactibacter massiliensis]